MWESNADCPKVATTGEATGLMRPPLEAATRRAPTAFRRIMPAKFLVLRSASLAGPRGCRMTVTPLEPVGVPKPEDVPVNGGGAENSLIGGGVATGVVVALDCSESDEG